MVGHRISFWLDLRLMRFRDWVPRLPVANTLLIDLFALMSASTKFRLLFSWLDNGRIVLVVVEL